MTKIRFTPLHRSAFCQFSFWWIYYYGNNKSTEKETGKSHLCAQCHRSKSFSYGPTLIQSLAYICSLVKVGNIFYIERVAEGEASNPHDFNLYWPSRSCCPAAKGQRSLKYGSEEKGSSLYKCSILLGFIMSKNLRGL